MPYVDVDGRDRCPGLAVRMERRRPQLNEAGRPLTVTSVGSAMIFTRLSCRKAFEHAEEGAGAVDDAER